MFILRWLVQTIPTSDFKLHIIKLTHIINKIHRYRPNFRLQVLYFMLHTSILTLMSEERKTTNEV